MNRNIDVEAIASKVKTHMMGDIRNEVIKLFEKSGVEAQTLARDLHISINAINAVMNQDASSLTLDAFIKLLIATGNALEVKPVMKSAKMPMRDDRGRFIPTPKMSPFVGGNRRPMSTMSNPTVAPAFRPFFANDEVVKPRPWEVPSNETTSFMTDLVGMNKQQLMGLVMRNRWDDEINIQNASRGELIDFIVNKRKENQCTTAQIAMPTPSPMGRDIETFENEVPVETTEPMMDFDGLMDAFKEFVKNNPSVIPSKR